MVGYLYPDGSSSGSGGANNSGSVSLVVFDKDGTILDFNRTWLPGLKECAQRVAVDSGEPELERALLKAGGWIEDEVDGPRISREGLMLHGTLEELAQEWIATQPIVAARYERDAKRLTTMLEGILMATTVRDATPLGPAERALRALRASGVQLAVVTNDQQELAKAQLRQLGWESLFCAVIGADSGFGGKPQPGGVSAAIEKAGVACTSAVMVGDSEGDMLAGKRAGCAFTIAIHPDGRPLPAGLAAAACRMPDISSVPAVLGLGAAPPAPPGWSASASGGPSRSKRDAEAAQAAAAAVDPDVVALVEGMA